MSEVHRQIILQKLIWWLCYIERERETTTTTTTVIVNGKWCNEIIKKNIKYTVHTHTDTRWQEMWLSRWDAPIQINLHTYTRTHCRLFLPNSQSADFDISNFICREKGTESQRAKRAREKILINSFPLDYVCVSWILCHTRSRHHRLLYNSFALVIQLKNYWERNKTANGNFPRNQNRIN